MTATLPLAGIKVLDLSTLLPGPLATLMLAEAGADVVKLERPGRGDEMRTYEPKFGEASANYAILNRGKRAYAVDFKDPTQRDRVLELAADADIVVEQFRPGVADRLGLGYDAVRERNPRIVYCSISGYGPTGPYASRAGHDLNYLAESGLLGVVTDTNGSPNLPVSVLADIAAGTYPAVMNVLLALRTAERTGEGVHLQISMTHNLQVLAYGYIATHQAGGGWPRPNSELLTGRSPRYHIYPAADGRHVACAALEQKFWDRLVKIVGLDEKFHDDTGQEQAVIAALTEVFASRPSGYWRELFAAEDVCTVVVNTWDEAVEAGLVDIEASARVSHPGRPDMSMPTLASPVDPALRNAGEPHTAPYPVLEPLPAASPWA
ncbi:CaiB/BaiF CoA transferase family protein [Mycolicibacterium smegmatis]|uniref:Alpha-methylacyl-CoA racemase n=1 Tax=Mycolicibacterium smegmatis (strain MKD8) TaxID=1214915 RepID=A0A2U9PIT3_MYCSE|nr:CaiB/BaiF CoA-transferase family protein [Mycolicibacterium smegmatis]AWT51595.1 alpha-methylacyl-CoA racemase [Mycolicibacterium smegmatis MKD8]